MSNVMSGQVYIQGTINISAAALARLTEMGVTPPTNHYPQGGEFDSFYLPPEQDGAEFSYRWGGPAEASRLTLLSEPPRRNRTL